MAHSIKEAFEEAWRHHSLDEAGELAELERDEARLATIARCKTIVCSPAARGRLPLACYLSLSTKMPTQECIDLLAFLDRTTPEIERRARALRKALKIGATEAAEVLGFLP